MPAVYDLLKVFVGIINKLKTFMLEVMQVGWELIAPVKQMILSSKVK